jgi:hypothetical protein
MVSHPHRGAAKTPAISQNGSFLTVVVVPQSPMASARMPVS